ncbi:MAG TPA: PrsW family glutamic-type intramembrane protease [Dongiaceae bacterium]|nr:PrsW family glutamic-type intramembrane protease [Dongiaceae bacterium]
MSLPIPAIAAVLFCAALFVLLFQHLFPRPAPWRLVGAAVAAGGVCTYVLSLVLRHMMGAGPASFDDLTTIPAAFTFAILRVGLPEELTKAVAALLALAPFWRRVTPAQAFQAALYGAVGFAIVENHGYATAFGQHAMLMAFGRGFLATLTHTLLSMIFGLFLMRFVAHGWRQWHLPVIGYLAAAGAHALYDTGLLPILAETLRAMRAGDLANMNVSIVLYAAPYVVGGIVLVLVAGLWSLRRAVRRAACDDLIVTEARHQAIVRRWRWTGTIVLSLGFLGLAAAIAWGLFAETPQQGKQDLGRALIGAFGFAGAIFAMILGWVLRQKR